jgi:hypothetical protein
VQGLCYAERECHKILQEREGMAKRLLNGSVRKLLLDDSPYINKDEVLNRLIAVLDIYGIQTADSRQ